MPSDGLGLVRHHLGAPRRPDHDLGTDLSDARVRRDRNPRIWSSIMGPIGHPIVVSEYWMSTSPSSASSCTSYTSPRSTMLIPSSGSMTFFRASRTCVLGRGRCRVGACRGGRSGWSRPLEPRSPACRSRLRILPACALPASSRPILTASIVRPQTRILPRTEGAARRCLRSEPSSWTTIRSPAKVSAPHSNSPTTSWSWWARPPAERKPSNAPASSLPTWCSWTSACPGWTASRPRGASARPRPTPRSSSSRSTSPAAPSPMRSRPVSRATC